MGANYDLQPTPAPAPAASPSTSRDARIFVREGVTWEIKLAGNAHVIRRVRGEAVESLTTTFTGAALAWRDAERRIGEQLENGFVEVAPED